MKSIIECLNRVDKIIFEKILKNIVIKDLEDIREHIEWRQADALARGEYTEERVAVLSVLSQINHIIERFYSDDTEEDLDEQYNKLRQRNLEWHDVINKKKPEINYQ